MILYEKIAQLFSVTYQTELSTLFEPLKKNRVVLIACAALSFLALAYVIYRCIKFKAHAQPKHSDLNKVHNRPQVIDSASEASLRKGFAIIPFLPEAEMDQRFEDLKQFDALNETYKMQYSEKEVEFGYAQLKQKKAFVIRNHNVPEELSHFLPYVAKVHNIALDIIQSIEKDLHLKEGTLTNAVSKDPLPGDKKSSSLLRLFAYDPCKDEGMAADEHEDLGLLTIIPRSQVPALEVMDYADNCNWVKLESQADRSQAIVLSGKTLEKMTQGKYLAAPHRVVKSAAKRYSIVYQLRAEPHAKIILEDREITVDEWLQKLKTQLTSVNGSY